MAAKAKAKTNAKKQAPAKKAKAKAKAPAKKAKAKVPAKKGKGKARSSRAAREPAELTAAISDAARQATLSTIALGVAYRRGFAWDAEADAVDTAPAAAGGFALAVPRAWSSPLEMPDGSVAFSIGDGFVLVKRVSIGEFDAPDLDAWVQIRRGQLPDDWLIIGHKPIAHASGRPAYETLELCALAAPPKVRVVRALFSATDLTLLTAVMPDEIPPERGREIAACFRSLTAP